MTTLVSLIELLIRLFLVHIICCFYSHLPCIFLILVHLMQFLTELDGVEVLTGVFVFAATRLVPTNRMSLFIIAFKVLDIVVPVFHPLASSVRSWPISWLSICRLKQTHINA